MNAFDAPPAGSPSLLAGPFLPSRYSPASQASTLTEDDEILPTDELLGEEIDDERSTNEPQERVSTGVVKGLLVASRLVLVALVGLLASTMHKIAGEAESYRGEGGSPHLDQLRPIGIAALGTLGLVLLLSAEWTRRVDHNVRCADPKYDSANSYLIWLAPPVVVCGLFAAMDRVDLNYSGGIDPWPIVAFVLVPVLVYLPFGHVRRAMAAVKTGTPALLVWFVFDLAAVAAVFAAFSRSRYGEFTWATDFTRVRTLLFVASLGALLGTLAMLGPTARLETHIGRRYSERFGAAVDLEQRLRQGAIASETSPEVASAVVAAPAVPAQVRRSNVAVVVRVAMLASFVARSAAAGIAALAWLALRTSLVDADDEQLLANAERVDRAALMVSWIVLASMVLYWLWFMITVVRTRRRALSGPPIGLAVILAVAPTTMIVVALAVNEGMAALFMTGAVFAVAAVFASFRALAACMSALGEGARLFMTWSVMMSLVMGLWFYRALYGTDFNQTLTERMVVMTALEAVVLLATTAVAAQATKAIHDALDVKPILR